MKPIFFFFTLLLTCSCKAQIINITDPIDEYIEGAYYKDINNLLNDFTGTYTYTNGSTSLKFILQKKIANPTMFDGNHFTEDLLIGEYQYIKDGVEKCNTLSDLNINMTNAESHGIDGNLILHGNALGCSDCGADEVQVLLSIFDNETHSSAQLILRKKIVNGQQALEANIWWHMKVVNEGETVVHAPFPGGDYIMVKQP